MAETLKQEIEALIKQGQNKKQTFKKHRDDEEAEESSWNLGVAQNRFESKTEVNNWYLEKLKALVKKYSHQY